jgi:4-alpha-glucanotransferase
MRDRAADRWGLYLDYPVGVHAGGFDTWRFRSQFANGLSVGAPPDALFEGGQNWGFPPMQSQSARMDGHAYFRKCLRTMLAHARVLRLDHVMGLHRLFCIPQGSSGANGMYVTQPADELYASLCIEAARANATIVGENLGTVTPIVSRTMRRRGLLGLHVQQFAFKPHERPVCAVPGRRMLASLNTHDTPTFAGFWKGKDIDARRSLRLVSAAQHKNEHAARADLKRAIIGDLRRQGLLSRGDTDLHAVLRALHRLLAESSAEMVLLTLEDLWLEERPQNLPGTGADQPNWRRKCARMLEEIVANEATCASIRQLHQMRHHRERSKRGVS